MPVDFVPGNDQNLSLWLLNFVTALDKNQQTLGVSAAEVAACQADLSGLNDALADHVAQQNAARAATTVKDGARAGAVATVRNLARRVQVAPGINDGLRAQLGISIPKTRARHLSPTVPADLVAVIRPDGRVLLRWDRNGNKPGVVYVVESRGAPPDGWGTAGVTTKTQFTLAGDAPGVAARYRVRALRGDGLSGASGEAVVWAG